MIDSRIKLTKQVDHFKSFLRRNINTIELKKYYGFVKSIRDFNDYGNGAIEFYVPFYHSDITTTYTAYPLDSRAYMLPVPGMIVLIEEDNNQYFYSSIVSDIREGVLYNKI
jgi:hypothetical protein